MRTPTRNARFAAMLLPALLLLGCTDTPLGLDERDIREELPNQTDEGTPEAAPAVEDFCFHYLGERFCPSAERPERQGMQ